jgi:probable phosphoglycerate mutase
LALRADVSRTAADASTSPRSSIRAWWHHAAPVPEERFHQRPYKPPSDATELVLVRHGASAAAVRGESFELVEGRSDPPLAPEGVEQAALVAAQLAGEAARGLFVSPLSRARQTAEPIAAACGVAPMVVAALREVHTGELEGGRFRIAVADRDPVILRLFAEERWDVIPGAENMETFEARVRAAAAEVVAACGPGVAIVVSHGGTIAELCRQATGSRAFAFLGVDNASISRIVHLPDGRQMLRSFNETAHLEGAAAAPPSRPRP